jgi:hypothetical protein
MIEFETYFVWKVILAVFGVLVMFPIAMYWLNTRQHKRNIKRNEKNL